MVCMVHNKIKQKLGELLEYKVYEENKLEIINTKPLGLKYEKI